MNYPSGTAYPTVGAQVAARLFTGRLDQQLAVGVIPRAGSALAVHAHRLQSDRERQAVARTLRAAVEQARSGRAPGGSMVPVHRRNVRAAADVIEAIAQVLQSPRRVNVMGMARLRRVLSDGQGPMYDGNAGDLVGRLSAAMAAL